MDSSNKMFFTKHATSVFSDWYASSVTIDGHTFKNSQTAFVYFAAVYFNDLATADLVLKSAQDPYESSLSYKNIANYAESPAWSEARAALKYKIATAKFTQNAALKQTLLDTVGLNLAAAFADDLVDGIGFDASDDNARCSDDWTGLNLLGNTLMQVRSDLA